MIHTVILRLCPTVETEHRFRQAPCHWYYFCHPNGRGPQIERRTHTKLRRVRQVDSLLNQPDKFVVARDCDVMHA